MVVLFEHVVDSVYQIVIDSAADAAIAELHHVLINGGQQLAIDIDIAKFIHQNRNFEVLIVGQNVVEQGSFAAAQKTGDDGDG